MVGMHRMVPAVISLTKAGGGHIPGGVAPGLKGGPQTAGGEGGGIRFTPDQLLAGEFHHDLSAAHRGDEAVVLLRRDAGHGLEPMSKMGSSLFHGPVLHSLGHRIGHGQIELGPLIHGLAQRFIHRLGQSGLHHAVVKGFASKNTPVRSSCDSPLSKIQKKATAPWNFTSKTPSSFHGHTIPFPPSGLSRAESQKISCL